MTPAPLKLKLGKLIKSSLRAACLKQTDLAQHLQISASAVSQMLNGNTAPTAIHLNEIFKLLDCHSNQVFMMRDLLSRIRSGMHELHSPVNDFIRDSRKARELSMIKLANLSKIPINELQNLETCSTVIPSNDQILQLSKVLKFKESDMQQLIDDLPLCNSDCYGNNIHEQRANHGNIDNLSTQIPVISIENMLKFNSVLEDIKNFVWINYDKVIFAQNLDDSIDHNNIFAIVAPGNDFTPNLPGLVRLIVSMADFPETNDNVIAKSKNSNKLQLKRFIIEKDNVSLIPFIKHNGYQKSKIESFEWVRKVLAIVISNL